MPGLGGSRIVFCILGASASILGASASIPGASPSRPWGEPHASHRERGYDASIWWKTKKLKSVVLALAVAACTSRAPKQDTRPLPLPPEAYSAYLHGRLAIQQGNYDEAIHHFFAASRAAPNEAHIRVALIAAYRRAGRHKVASDLAELAQKQWPQEPVIWLESGAVFRRVNRLSEAVQAYERARKLDPLAEEAYLGLAATHIAMRRQDRAEDTYRALLRRIPDSVQGNYRLATLLIQRRQFAKAAPLLARALDANPDHVSARIALARAQTALGKKEQALHTLRDAFDRSGGDPRVGEELFARLLDAGEEDSAAALLGVMMRDDLADESKAAIGHMYLRIGMAKPALAIADAMLAQTRQTPQSPETPETPETPEAAQGTPSPQQSETGSLARALKATALRSIGQLAQAAAVFAEVQPDQPLYAECQAEAAVTLAQQGNHDDALATLKRAFQHAPEHVALLAALGQVSVQRGEQDKDKARVAFRRALANRPDDMALLFAYGAFEDTASRPDEAVAVMEQILAAYPEHVAALNFLGYSLADRNVELGRAAQALGKARALEPDNPFILDSYGWLKFRQGKLTEALIALQRAARLAPAEPEVHFHLGEVYGARNDTKRALRHLRRARSLRPGPRLRERIDARIQALAADK